MKITKENTSQVRDVTPVRKKNYNSKREDNKGEDQPEDERNENQESRSHFHKDNLSDSKMKTYYNETNNRNKDGTTRLMPRKNIQLLTVETRTEELALSCLWSILSFIRLCDS